jgi:predicted AlkP superfamily pyrophosphatase or phosphodiesterase
MTAEPGKRGTYYPLQKRVDTLLQARFDSSKWPEDMKRYISRDLKVHHLASNLFKEQIPETRFLYAYYSSPDAFGHHYGTRINMKNTSTDERARLLQQRDKVYQMLDSFLQDLIPLIDDRTLLMICSDHGFRYDKRMHNYRVDGMLIIYGRDVRNNTQIAADVYSIAPTILYALGMPPSTEFEGLALKQAFTGTINHPAKKFYSYNPQFFEIISDQEFEEDKMQELQDLQYINR